MVVLALESENGAVLTYRLSSSQITVGSSSRNDVVVRSPGVAERHLVMHRTGEVFTFVTGERLTVVLNGERRSRGVLNPGDKIRIGGVNLVFRGGDGGVGEEPGAPSAGAGTPQRQPAEKTLFLADPAGFAAGRAALVALLAMPGRDCFQRLIGAIRDALPGVELAVLVPGDGDAVALASVWSGGLPRVDAAAVRELAAPGRYAQVTTAGVAVVVVPVCTLSSELVAVIAARPIGSLGSEGVALLCEAARLLGMRWHDIGRDHAATAGDEHEAVRRLEAQVPGSSQAVQVLRAGMLAATVGHDPVLICGGEGVGRTATARTLAGLCGGGNGDRRVVVVECRGRDETEVRTALFGPAGHASLTASAGGALGQAAGGILILRDADRLPVALQAELAGLIAAQQRVPGGDVGVRWFLTCGEDPLALVQQGRLGPELFVSFSRRMLRVPRLAERREDLPLLIANLLRQVAADQGKALRGITLECLNTMLARSFPGEMAELVGEVNRLVTATADGEMVRCDNLAPGRDPADDRGATASGGDVLASDSLKEVVPRVERLVIDRVMRRLKGNQSKAARTLEISRGALIAKLKEYGVPDYRYLRRRPSRS